jgi:hypothetical protein
VGSITLRSLALFNFRSFRGLHSITFPEKGLVILRGENRDTRGDSGAGKTNVLLALAYAFGYCRHSAKALQCWYDEDPMYVEVELDTPDGVATIRRGIKGLAITSTTGKLFKGRPAEEHLDRLCGVPSELREILTYRAQVKPKKFLDMRDGALKKFLTQVLQLHGLDKEIGAADKLLTDLDKKRETASIILFNACQDAERREQELVEFYPEDTRELEAELGTTHVAIDTMKADLFRGENDIVNARREEGEKAMEVGLAAHKRADILEHNARAIRDLPPPEMDRTVLDALKDKHSQALKFLAQLEAADKLAWKAYEEETATARAEARKLHNELGRVPGLQDDVRRLSAEVVKLEEDLCDRCGRQWDNAKEALAEHLVQVQQKTNELVAISAHQKRLKELEAWLELRKFEHDPRLAKLNVVAYTLDDQIKAEQRRLDSDENEIYMSRDAEARDLLSQAHVARAEGRAASQEYLSRPDLPSAALRASQEALRGFLAKAETQLATLKGKLALVRQENEAGLKRHDETVKAATAAVRRRTNAQVDADAAEQAWKAQFDYVDLLKGFRNKIFDEVLEAISADATAIIGTLPNSQHITIDFRSERETGEGTIQEKITPVTLVHGVERDLDEAVSGGQLTSIGLAVDLAVAGVISSRLGCHLNWVVLDESFEGHDAVTKLSCLEMLQAYAADKLVIIVDHMSEFKESVL